MSTTPATQAGETGSGNRRRWIITGIVVIIIVGIALVPASEE